jgi:hypothetical protein
MKKLRLDPDALTVESFDPSPLADGQGTVLGGQNFTIARTCRGTCTCTGTRKRNTCLPTAGFDPTCQPTCQATCEATCPATCAQTCAATCQVTCANSCTCFVPTCQDTCAATCGGGNSCACPETMGMRCLTLRCP